MKAPDAAEMLALAERVEGLDYRSNDDMATLADAVLKFHDDQLFAAEIFANDLMRPQWWIRLAMRFMIWRTGSPAWRCWLEAVGRFPELATIAPALADHIRTGKDQFDWRSAGGLCREEVAMLERMLKAAAVRAIAECQP